MPMQRRVQRPEIGDLFFAQWFFFNLQKIEPSISAIFGRSFLFHKVRPAGQLLLYHDSQEVLFFYKKKCWRMFCASW